MQGLPFPRHALAGAVLVATACGAAHPVPRSSVRDAPCCPEPARGASPDAAASASPLSVDAFDCSSVAEHEALGEPVTQDGHEGMRQWNHGGPGGAAWNWHGSALACTLEVTAPCASRVQVGLHLGDARHPAETLSLRPNAPRRVEFVVAPDVWQAALRGGEVRPYETLFVAVEVNGQCTDAPIGLHGSDSFVGGAATGE